MPGKSSTPKKFLITVVIILAAFLLGKSITQTPKPKSQISKQKAEPENIKDKPTKVVINGYTFSIETADNDDLRGKGLSGRDELSADEGMLFIFERPAFYSFWMKDMKFPLDFIWIKGDRIVDISENIPVPDTDKIEELETFTSKSAVDKVLEISAGKVKEINAKIGDGIKLIK